MCKYSNSCVNLLMKLGNPLASTIALIFISIMSGCGFGPSLHAEDTAIIAELEAYQPTYELDNNGRIRLLKLEGRHVDDNALNHVASLKGLRALSLHGASVTDLGLEKLRDSKLERLGLTATLITDKGLDHLETMSRLRDVWLMHNNRLSSERIALLQQKPYGLIKKIAPVLCHDRNRRVG